MRRIDDLDEYHAEIVQYVDEFARCYGVANVVEIFRSGRLHTAPFVFQDETPENFRSDILKECKRRMNDGQK